MAVYYLDPGYLVPDNYFQDNIFIDWGNKIIYVPKAYMNLVQSVPTVIYELDTNQFRNDLKDLEDSPEGMVYPDTHRHNTTVTVGGVDLARVIEIINGYTITFEDDKYAVNLYGSNNNIGDVTNVNQVSVRSSNSAGLQTFTYTTGGGVGTVTEVADAVWNAAMSSYVSAGTTGSKLNAAGNSGDPWNANLDTYATPGTAGYELRGQKTFQSDISAQVQAITPSSTALHTQASSFQLVNGTVLSGTYVDTHTYDEAAHYIRDSAGLCDFNYTFNIGQNKPSNFHFSGYVSDKHEVMSVYAYDWNTLQYEKIGEITGVSANANFSWALYTHHVNNSGNVRIRFASTAISDIFIHVDQIYVGYMESAPSATTIADAVRTELTPELTQIMQIPTSGTGLTTPQATMLLEMYQLLGLDPTKPLIVTQTSRAAGTISQTIDTNANSTTVTRVQ